MKVAEIRVIVAPFFSFLGLLLPGTFKKKTGCDPGSRISDPWSTARIFHTYISHSTHNKTLNRLKTRLRIISCWLSRLPEVTTSNGKIPKKKKKKKPENDKEKIIFCLSRFEKKWKKMKKNSSSNTSANDKKRGFGIFFLNFGDIFAKKLNLKVSSRG